jgi:sugar/nucleoside kinase (ribokinase family)
VKSILDPAMHSLDAALTDLYTSHASLLHFLGRSGLPRPAALRVAAQFAIHAQLRRALAADPIEPAAIERLLAEAREDAVVIDQPTLGYLADERMHAAMERLQQTPAEPEAVRRALQLAKALQALPFSVDLWQAQNIWYELSSRFAGEEKTLRDHFLALGAALNIRVDRPT